MGGVTDWRAAYYRFALVKCHRTNKVRVTDRREAASVN
jgi:hypothetical protein